MAAQRPPTVGVPQVASADDSPFRDEVGSDDPEHGEL